LPVTDRFAPMRVLALGLKVIGTVSSDAKASESFAWRGT
jgi:hypothetical protein